MGTSTAAARTTGKYNNRAFWEGIWRLNGNSIVLFAIIAWVLYGSQPQVGAPADAVVAFFAGHRTRILIAVVLSGLNVLNLMWFAATLRTVLVDAGQDGWGAAETASSAAVGALFLLLLAVSAGLAYSIAASGNSTLATGLNDLTWAVLVLSSFPRAMLVMSGSFGFWRAGLISSRLFGACVALVVLGVLGGTTWVSGGFWAPDGVYSRVVWPVLGIVWVAVFNRVLTRAPATRAAW